ncbi:MAG TPA: hypothetical protein P5186_20270 [Candidatus Paceibacterota bacterium]|nr:hypothetical protein [Candidatus Paceibacterota bacterium]HSA03644.1 hypothetical protein [Candidatus Paceibacterota bacterium]
MKKLDQRFPELAGFNFWSDEGHYNVVGNRNTKKLIADPRIIALNSRDKLRQRLQSQGGENLAALNRPEFPDSSNQALATRATEFFRSGSVRDHTGLACCRRRLGDDSALRLGQSLKGVGK